MTTIPPPDKHATFLKGNIALTKVICDLTCKGYQILMPLCEQLPFDCVIHKDGQFKRIQVKWAQNKDGAATIKNHSYVWYRKTSKKYKETDFDYYAVYIAAIDRVIYPSVRFGGASIRFEKSGGAAWYYWFEDFLDFTDQAEKHQADDVDWQESIDRRNATIAADPTHPHNVAKARLELLDIKTLVWSKRMDIIAQENHVSIHTLRRRCKELGIEIPPKQYWILRASGYTHEDALVYKKPTPSPRKLLADDQVVAILQDLKTDKGIREIGRIYSVPHTTVLSIRNNQTYRHVPRV